MAPAPKSRRSFIVEALTAAAGAWVALAGLLGLSTAASGCDNAEKYGGPPKYGGPDDLGPHYETKYGGPEMGPPKYGGPVDLGPRETKYGGPVELGPKKYGGPTDAMAG